MSRHLWPRYRRLLGASVASAFTFWKTSDAEPLITSLNVISPLALGRTVDLTDLIALPMIPLGMRAAPQLTPWRLPRVLQFGLAVLAPLAFTATSAPQHLLRSTLDVSSATEVDEAALQIFFDEVADEHGLRCRVCDPLDEERVVPAARLECEGARTR